MILTVSLLPREFPRKKWFEHVFQRPEGKERHLRYNASH